MATSTVIVTASAEPLAESVVAAAAAAEVDLATDFAPEEEIEAKVWAITLTHAAKETTYPSFLALYLILTSTMN